MGKKGKESKALISVLRLIFGLGAVLGILIAHASQAEAVDRHVYSGESIQAAIDAASSGDVIIVHQGTYVENINFSGKAITVQSDNPNDPAVVEATVIDGGQAGSVVTFQSGEGSGSVLSGFTVRNGMADSGGGIYCSSSSPNITNCTISENSTDGGNGGGIYCSSSSPSITHCTISDNWASGNSTGSGEGGGIYCCSSSSPSIANCTISNNSAMEIRLIMAAKAAGFFAPPPRRVSPTAPSARIRLAGGAMAAGFPA